MKNNCQKQKQKFAHILLLFFLFHSFFYLLHFFSFLLLLLFFFPSKQDVVYFPSFFLYFSFPLFIFFFLFLFSMDDVVNPPKNVFPFFSPFFSYCFSSCLSFQGACDHPPFILWTCWLPSCFVFSWVKNLIKVLVLVLWIKTGPDISYSPKRAPTQHWNRQ
jgi:hypothetical protein